MTSTEARLADVAAAVATCVRCPQLAGGRTTTVPGDFPAAARVLLVGEGPGADEDASGHPFVGRSGRLLDTLLDEAGLPRSSVAVANVVKCRPPGNRAPTRTEVGHCRPYLAAQLGALDPAVVVALGGTATAWFLGPGARLTALRGRAHRVGGRLVLVTYHPSAALRFGPAGAPRAALRDDLALAARLAAGRADEVPG